MEFLLRLAYLLVDYSKFLYHLRYQVMTGITDVIQHNNLITQLRPHLTVRIAPNNENLSLYLLV